MQPNNQQPHLKHKHKAIKYVAALITDIVNKGQTKAQITKDLKTLFEGLWIDDLPVDDDYKLALRVECIIRFGQYFFTAFFPVAHGDFHREVLANLITKSRFVIAAPREHAKSTTVSFLFVTYCIVYNRKRFILLVSDTASQAENFVRDIKDELETNTDLLEFFGKLEGKNNWTASDFTTSTGVRLMAKGAGQSLRGVRKKESRPDLVICDDLENDELVNTVAQRDKLYNWFNKVLINVTGKGGQIAFIGTILHYDSVLQRLLDSKKNDDRWYTHKYVAWWDDGDTKKILWSEWWSLDRLIERRQDIGEFAFQSEFLNEPIDDSTAIFKREWIFNNAFDLKDLPRGEDGEPDIKATYGAIDPAISKSETADYTAICTVYLDKDGFIWVVGADQSRSSLNEQVQKVCQLHELYDYDKFGVETVAYQAGLKQEIDRESRLSNLYIPTQKLTPTRDKVSRAQILSVYFEQGIIKIRKDLEPLINQLLVFPKGEHDDLVDALVYAVLLAKPAKKRVRVFARKPKGF